MRPCCRNSRLLPFRPKNFEKTEEYRKAYNSKGDRAEGHSNGRAGEKAGSSNAPSSGYIQRITNDVREDEMDENIGWVS